MDIEFEQEWETTSDWNEDDDEAVAEESALCFPEDVVSVSLLPGGSSYDGMQRSVRESQRHGGSDMQATIDRTVRDIEANAGWSSSGPMDLS